MQVIGVPMLAKKWGVSENTLRRWLHEGLIPGAEQDGKGRPWRIPEDAECPVRIKRRKEK